MIFDKLAKKFENTSTFEKTFVLKKVLQTLKKKSYLEEYLYLKNQLLKNRRQKCDVLIHHRYETRNKNYGLVAFLAHIFSKPSYIFSIYNPVKHL